MSTRGRKADLKSIEGGLTGVPKAPASIPANMVDEWTAIAADLVERKLLNAPALGLLETYMLARWACVEAQKAIGEHGALTKGTHGSLKPNPACGFLSKSMEAVARLGAELGISPAARSKSQFQSKGGKRNAGAPAGLDI